MYGFFGALVATVAVFTPSFLILTGIMPFYDKLKTSLYFLRATRGILASFVGLLFYATLKFGSAVQWDTVRILLGLTAFAALMRKVDILYVVLIGSVISVIIF
ncbi:MAG: chromate transporter [Nitrospirota bacterium]